MQLVLNYNNNMTENKLNLVYHGEINQSITRTFTSLAEQNLNRENVNKMTVRKVYHVMVECMQNIYKHSQPSNEHTSERAGQGIILVGQDTSGYIVATGNPVNRNRAIILSEILDNINSKSMSELDTIYKRKMKDGLLSKKGGAGLGFIDISRKTGSKLDYKFESIDKKNSFFILKTYIAK